MNTQRSTLNSETDCLIFIDRLRKIKRKDFYWLLDGFVPEILRRRLKGEIHLDLDESLPEEQPRLRKIKDEILRHAGFGRGAAECSFGRVSWDLSPVSDVLVDSKALYSRMSLEKPPEAERAVFFRAVGSAAADPITITVLSQKANRVLAHIRERLSEAANRQLPKDEPGMIACHIPEIASFDELGGNTGLSSMVVDLFSEPAYKHVAAIVFSSDSRPSPALVGLRIDVPALGYANANSPFTDAAKDIAKALHFQIS
jgi:hypothetical protein